MILAHVGGFPLEELLTLAPSAGVFWLALRARIRGRDGGSGPRRELGWGT
jgi:hypothetical protein